MGRSGKGLTNSQTRKNSRTSITDITNQYFREFLREFRILPYLGYKSKQVHNEQTED